MINFYMMVGLPGSGKSYEAEEIKRLAEDEVKIVSSDNVREEIYGDAANQSNPQKVFRIVHQRVKDTLKSGISCIYDATNISAKRRAAFLREINNIPCNQICVFVATPVEVCKARNSKRSRVVPDTVIDRMANQFEVPSYTEGWTEIVVNRDRFFEGFYGTVEDFFSDYGDYDQENYHHTLTLGEHCRVAAEYVREHYKGSDKCVMVAAAGLHDCGKIATKTYRQKDPYAHYYGHQNRGAYDSFFYEKLVGTMEREQEVALLINRHMDPYFWDKTVSQKKENEWGKSIFDKIVLLHEADEAAH